MLSSICRGFDDGGQSAESVTVWGPPPVRVPTGWPYSKFPLERIQRAGQVCHRCQSCVRRDVMTGMSARLWSLSTYCSTRLCSIHAQHANWLPYQLFHELKKILLFNSRSGCCLATHFPQSNIVQRHVPASNRWRNTASLLVAAICVGCVLSKRAPGFVIGKRLIGTTGQAHKSRPIYFTIQSTAQQLPATQP